MPEILLPTSPQQMVAERLSQASSFAHDVNGRPTIAPYITTEAQAELGVTLEEAAFGLGCFWGAERKFWNTAGVYTTAVGYAAGHAVQPTYQQVCTGTTGHAEVVLVVFDRNQVSFEQLLAVFFESHNPTQGMRQGNDIGSQYRSGIYCVSDAQMVIAERVRKNYQGELLQRGFPEITTEIQRVERFFYAEDYHQQYLSKNPAGYCGIGGTGISCPI